MAVKNDRFEIYDIIQEIGQVSDFKIEDSEKNFKHRIILEYKIYGNIITAEKIPTKKYKYDIIVLLVDYAKLVFLYFDKINLNFKLICLYNFEIDFPPLSYGKDFLYNTKENFYLNLVYSKTSESLIFSFFEKNLVILKLRSILNFEENEIPYNITNKENTINNNENLNGSINTRKIQNGNSSILDLDYINKNPCFIDNLDDNNLLNYPNRKYSFNENIQLNKRNYETIKEKFGENKNNILRNGQSLNNIKSNISHHINNINNPNAHENVDYYAESINGFYLFEPSIILDFGGMNYEIFSNSINDLGPSANKLNKNGNNRKENLNVNSKHPRVKRIIKFYPFNKNNEVLDFNNYIKCENTSDNIQMLLLYEEFSSPIQTENPNIIQNNIQFVINKINIAYISISKLNRDIENFQVIYEDLNQNSYDLMWIPNKKIIFIFSPYTIQIINLFNWENKQIYSVIINSIEAVQNANYYSSLNFKHSNLNSNNTNNPHIIFNSNTDEKIVFEDKNFINLNIDLRGGAFLCISDFQFLFTTSKGGLYVFTAFEMNSNIPNQNYINQNNHNNFINNFYSFKIEQIKIKDKNEYLQYIGAPYNTLLLPHKEVFFLSSPFADSILINFQGSKYILSDRIISLAPIHHFHSYFDRYHTKYYITSGIDKETYLGFLYKNFFFEITRMISLDDINYIKTINFHPEKHTQYIIAHFKKGEVIIYEVKSNIEINNFSEKINFLGSKIHSLNSGLHMSGNYSFKPEIKFLKAETLILMNYENYLNKNPEINILSNSIMQKFGGNGNNANLNKINIQNGLFNDFILFVFEDSLQIFNKQFGLIITIRIEDIIITSFKIDNLDDMKNHIDGTPEKEMIKDAFVYYDKVIIYTFSGKVLLIKFGFANNFDIDYNIRNSKDLNESKK